MLVTGEYWNRKAYSRKAYSWIVQKISHRLMIEIYRLMIESWIHDLGNEIAL